MPAQSEQERDNLRLDLGHDTTSLPDAAADVLFDRAEAEYAGYSRAIIFAAARLRGRRQIKAQANKQVDYQANQAEEKLSQIAKALAEDIEQDELELNELLQKERSSARVGLLHRKPMNYREMP